MFRKLFKILKHLKSNVVDNKENNGVKSIFKTENIPTSIGSVKKKLEATFAESEDFVVREIELGKEVSLKVLVAYIDGLIDKKVLEDSVVSPLMLEAPILLEGEKIKNKDIINIFTKKLIAISSLNITKDFKDTVMSILSGMAIVFIDGQSEGIKVPIQMIQKRSVTEPEGEKVVRGPREGFVESLTTNISLLRHKIKNPKFKFETIQLGEQTNTIVGICYIKGIANEKTLNVLKSRLKKIKVDSILDSGEIEQYIEDDPFAVFPTIGNSEKPDKVAAKILEGRVAIIVDGSPIALTAPNLFIENFQTTEDYHSRLYFGSFNRTLRLASLFLATILPAFYVAVVVFHFDVIPIQLLLAVSATREGLPFSPLVEALFMMIVFELLRESGVRMPGAIGQTISIVGGLVIGQAAVSAKIVSPIMVIIIALTGITNFILPSLSDTLPIIRFLLLFAAQTFGFLGIFIGYLLVLIHLCSLESFGVPYMYPLSPEDKNGLKDSFIRFPLWMMKLRPKAFTWQNSNKSKYRSSGDNHVNKEDQ